MGLDTSHDCWHGPYSSFNDFRRAVAKVLGFDLDSMVGFGGLQSWDDLPADALHPLLNHSDCEGQLTPQECAGIMKRLREIAPDLGEWQARAEQFAAGCEQAAAAGEVVDFH